LARFLLWFGLAITLIGALTYFLQYTPAMAEFDTRQPGLIISLVGIALSVWGFAREMRATGVAWEKSLGVKILSVSLVLTALYVSNTFFAFHQEEVQFKSGNVVLAGTLLIPNGGGPHPALTMMHGSGEATRMGMFAEAQSLARQGVAVLIYDKRGSGASVGGHYRSDGYEALASDGVAAISFLQNRSDIDPKQVGLWGTSEGGWTAPMAASKIDDLAFLIIISGGPLTPAEQGTYEQEYRLRYQRSPDEAIDLAYELATQYNAIISSEQDRDELTERQQFNRGQNYTDVAPLLEEMDFPILYVLGARDPLIPSPLVKAQVENILGNADHQDFMVMIFPEATHNVVTAGPADCVLCVPDEITGIGPIRPWFAPGYLAAVSDWVRQRVETAS
jgi:pimeloyl-ACP methyl ester carboxylesterase